MAVTERGSPSAPPEPLHPVTVAQEELWALSQSDAPPACVNLGYALAIDGPLAPDALAAAFTSAVERYPPLRSTYAWRGGSLVAEVRDVEFGALGNIGEPELVSDRTEALAAVRAERNRRFALDAEPPYRARLLREPSGRHVLLLTMHHIVADGWALERLATHLSGVYARSVAGEPPVSNGNGTTAAAVSPPPGAAPPADRDVQACVTWLADASPTIARFGAYARPSVVEVQRESVLLDGAPTQRLRALARRSGTSLFGVLLAALECALASWSNTDDFLIGTLAANRESAASAERLGAHYNPALIRASLPADPTVADALLGANAALLRALDSQTIPYRTVRAALRERIGSSAERVPAVMLLLDRYPLEKLELAACDVAGLHLDEGGARTSLPGGGPRSAFVAASAADLTFFVREVGDRLTLSAIVRRDHPAAAEVVPLLATFLRALELLDEAPETPLAELATEPDERQEASPATEEATPALRENTEIAPIDSLSPVGCWTDERRRS
jgi:hypothetical protein